MNGVDEVVLSLYAKGLTTGEISAHFAEISVAAVSKETISPDYRQGGGGDKRLGCGTVGLEVEWFLPVMFIEAVFVTIRDG